MSPASQALLRVTSRSSRSAHARADGRPPRSPPVFFEASKRRLNHSAAVAAEIDRVAYLVEPEWRSAVKDAAWLHDVGYSPELALTGFHPLDGARWLRDHDWPTETCRLVAWHTEPLQEARLHGLARGTGRGVRPAAAVSRSRPYVGRPHDIAQR